MSHKRLLISLLVSFYLTLYVNCSCINGQPPPHYSLTDFYINPANVPLITCDLSSGHSCCSEDLDREIGGYADYWTSTWISFFSTSQGECKGAIQGISCVLCSQYQSLYLQLYPQMQLKLCSYYCTQLYNSCLNSHILSTTQSVGSQYSSASDFCYDLIESVPALELILMNGSGCWGDVPECTPDSYESEYTQCVNGQRSLIYSLKSGEVCQGGTPLPSPVSNLPCDLQCPIGKYVSGTGCTDCAPGSYSLGSAVREDTWNSWDDLNLPIISYCTQEDPFTHEETIINDCGWELGGFEVNSGRVIDSQKSYLEFTTLLTGNGALAFDYRVNSEPNYDGLTVYVDGVVKMPMMSTQLDYTLMIINLTGPAFHYIQFVYSKDESLSKGMDKAYINLVQVSPINNAADFCEPCRAGRYQSQSGKSFCIDCPAFTYSPEGQGICYSCPDNYYSYMGSATCTPKEDCTIDDVQYLYTDCTLVNGQLSQVSYPVWNDPHICNDHGNSVPPYPNSTSDCVSCNPGEYRDLAGRCKFCSPGLWSDNNSIFCSQCEAGNAAVKTLYFDYFDSWDNGLSTSCKYFCGTPGWVLHNGYIDSGSGHGAYVNSILNLDTVLEREGKIKFSFSLNCTYSCSLSFISSSGDGATWSGGSGAIFSRSVVFNVPEGDAHFEWSFSKNDPVNNGRHDAAQITSIIVSNVKDGGAYECTSCTAGTYAATTGSTYCIDCPAGTYSAGNAVECIPCDDGYFSSAKMSSCQECGEGTFSNSDKSGCEITCTLTTDDAFFDLNPMVRTDNQMYGPVYDNRQNSYFLNICTKEHNNNTCIDLHHNPVDSYACQVTSYFGVDLGNMFGILPLRSNYTGLEGVTIHLTNGSSCFNQTSGSYFHRQTYIDIICDPYAGIGSPVAAAENNVVEDSKCVYQFSWNSLYGCHVCTEDDYTYITTKCRENMRQIEYIWKDNPKACHSGVSLPDPQNIPCGIFDTTSCPPGQYLDISLNVRSCVDVDAGFFSIGGGLIYNNWDPTPEGFITVGFEPCAEGIRSTSINSYLLYLENFVEVGSFKVTFKVLGVENNGGFSIYLDDDLYLGPILSTDGLFTTIIIPNISVGQRLIKLAYENGIYIGDNEFGKGVVISEIVCVGLAYAAEYQLPCPAGTFSNTGAIECTKCPENTYSDETSDSCIDCEEGYYSFEGASECIPKPNCTIDDYQKVYGPCVNGYRTAIYTPIAPYICDILGDDDLRAIVVSSDDKIECDYYPCEPGEYRNSNSDAACRTCDIGYYWDSSSNKCSQSDIGYAGLLQTGFYNQPESVLPVQFVTGCNGNCLGYGGWRSRNDYLDSGYYSNFVDVFLDLNINLLFDGSVTFDYDIEGSMENGIYVFVNHQQQDIEFHPNLKKRTTSIIQLNEGPNTIRWVYHQNGEEGRAILKNIIIEGAGGATNQIPCPPGSYSAKKGSNSCTSCSVGTYSSSPASGSCTPCSNNFFAESEGATLCIACGENTISNSDRDDCNTTCVFNISENRTVDFNLLSEKLTSPFYLSSSQQLLLNLCEKRANSLFCFDSNGDSIDTYSCQVNSNGYGIDSGRILSVHVEENDDITFLYTNGDTTEQCAQPIQTEIRFHCDALNDNSLPYALPQSNDCHLVLQWDISYACPVCGDSDYALRESDCENGISTSANIRQTNCSGILVKDSETNECTTSLSVSIIVIIAVVIVLFILVVVIIIIVVWNGKIHSDYKALVQKSSGEYEMSEAPNAVTQ